MSKLIRKYYFFQLLISFVLFLGTINIFGVINNIDNHTQGQLFVISTVGALLFMILNALINSLNFLMTNTKNEFLAFHLPIIIWLLAVSVYSYFFFESSNTLISKWFHLVYLIQPAIYNLLLLKVISKLSKSME